MHSLRVSRLEMAVPIHSLKMKSLTIVVICTLCSTLLFGESIRKIYPTVTLRSIDNVVKSVRVGKDGYSLMVALEGMRYNLDEVVAPKKAESYPYRIYINDSSGTTYLNPASDRDEIGKYIIKGSGVVFIFDFRDLPDKHKEYESRIDAFIRLGREDFVEEFHKLSYSRRRYIDWLAHSVEIKKISNKDFFNNELKLIVTRHSHDIVSQVITNGIEYNQLKGLGVSHPKMKLLAGFKEKLDGLL